MSFPAPSLGAPTLTTLQFKFAGQVFGGLVAGSTYQTQKIDGVDSMPISGGDVQRPFEKGSFSGVDVAAGRDITIAMIVRAATGSALATARQALSAVMVPMGATEQALWVQSENGCYACMVRPEKYNFSLDSTMIIGKGGVATMLFRASDPRLYAAPSKASVAQSVSGLTLPFTLPGVLGGTSTFTVTNGTAAVNCETRPLLVFNGPSISPVMTNQTITGSPWIGFNVTLLTGDVLTVDTDMHTAVVVRSGFTVGTSVQNTWIPGGTWWGLQPGSNTLLYTSSGAADTGTAVVQSADAYVGL